MVVPRTSPLEFSDLKEEGGPVVDLDSVASLLAHRRALARETEYAGDAVQICLHCDVCQIPTAQCACLNT
jgi:hypothetical protein